jgi:maltose alpha-D-glucosyltransferase / alpha-amylase
VRQAVFRTMRFWLDMGVDGFRLDAIPYLIERDGTSNENLRETHEVIREIRARLDARYSNRLLLAEANMWPEDVREYFGDGDQCHMAYHFPLMPRMYMAIAMEDRHPIAEILQQTPDIPESCQWSIFLRNHDELTLEMVTSKERDYMYQMYAADKRARINLGIRRRLAPLMENDRARIELMNSLLLSMPGSPTIYYGDEIGMGDNIFLGDRDGVRTPMQWSSDRNGGFSRADPQQLYLPPIQDPVYGYEAINVEAQRRAPGSLLNWMRRLLAVRASSQAFGRGRFTMLAPGNRKILAYVREHGQDVILCIANLARTAQPVELDLARFRGRVPVEMIGRTSFPPIGALPYLLTLPAHGFYWFRLATDEPAPQWHEERLAPEVLPVLVLFDGWASLFRERVVPWRIGMAERTRATFERELLPAFLARQRWFAGRFEAIARVQIIDHALLSAAGHDWLLALVEGESPAEQARYFLPLALAWEGSDEERMKLLAPCALARVRQQASVGLMADAAADESFCTAVVAAIGEGRELRSGNGSIRFTPTAAFGRIVGAAQASRGPATVQSMRQNSVVLLGGQLFLKLYRRLREGKHPEPEVGRFLTDVARFEHCVPVAGSIDYLRSDGTTITLGALFAFTPNQGDAFAHAVDSLARHLEMLRTLDPGQPPPADEGFLTLMRTLGLRTAQLHAALALRSGDDAFDPEPLLETDWPLWVRQVRDAALAAMNLLSSGREALPPELQERAQRLFAAGPRLMQHVERHAALRPGGLKTRHHGDYHLGQVLLANNDFVIIDFEGDPALPIDERRRKHLALRDVAGMLRSFDYVRHLALLRTAQGEAEARSMAPAAAAWLARSRSAFLDAYRDEAVRAGLYADAAAFAEQQQVLALFELERALYELNREMDQRPEWAGVPLDGIAALAGL